MYVSLWSPSRETTLIQLMKSRIQQAPEGNIWNLFICSFWTSFYSILFAISRMAHPPHHIKNLLHDFYTDLSHLPCFPYARHFDTLEPG
jgi:hypothetical protein